MTRWLRTHAFAANAFASYPLHGPRVTVVTEVVAYDPNAGRRPRPRPRPLEDDRRRLEEDEALILILLSGDL